MSKTHYILKLSNKRKTVCGQDNNVKKTRKKENVTCPECMLRIGSIITKNEANELQMIMDFVSNIYELDIKTVSRKDKFIASRMTYYSVCMGLTGISPYKISKYIGLDRVTALNALKKCEGFFLGKKDFRTLHNACMSNFGLEMIKPKKTIYTESNTIKLRQLCIEKFNIKLDNEVENRFLTLVRSIPEHKINDVYKRLDAIVTMTIKTDERQRTTEKTN